MSPPTKAQITGLLVAWGHGDQAALDHLLPLVYDELRNQAALYLRRERTNHTLQPTALVNEVYLRLIDQQRVHWKNRAQFFGVAAQMMRRILVSHARSRHAAKRGGANHRLTLEEGMALSESPDVNLLALDDALTRLESIDPDKSRLVELRFFSGLTIDETAEVMCISARSVDRQWQTAKAWLHREISRSNTL